MSERRETIADIIAEKRFDATTRDQFDSAYIVDFCDRLEAAHRRECGNSAALREALMKCQEITLQWQADERLGVAGSVEKPEARSASDALIDIEFVAHVALAAPPRNCDVGDAADWEKRFGEECDKGHICSDCPVKRAKTRMAIKHDKGARCEFAWAQMPYVEKEGGNDGK